MKQVLVAAAFVTGMAAAAFASAQAVVGQAAPAFKVSDTNGKTVSLSDYKGKYVVLEWVNPDCPFVKKHYDSGNIPATQKHAASKGVAWLTIDTTNGVAGNAAATAKLASWAKEKNATPNAILVDKGEVGRAYGAKTTPHLYLIDPAGKVVYAGAIDSKASSNPADIKGATNYVAQAIDEVSAGKPVSRPATQPYGCSVKYANAG